MNLSASIDHVKPLQGASQWLIGLEGKTKLLAVLAEISTAFENSISQRLIFQSLVAIEMAVRPVSSEAPSRSALPERGHSTWELGSPPHYAESKSSAICALRYALSALKANRGPTEARSAADAITPVRAVGPRRRTP